MSRYHCAVEKAAGRTVRAGGHPHSDIHLRGGFSRGKGDMMIVFLLHHIRKNEDGDDDEKLIGIYTTREKAEAAIQRAVILPGFRDFPNGFEVFEHLLDRDDWREGFVLAEDA